MADETHWTERHRGLDPSSTSFVPSQRAHHAEWLSRRAEPGLGEFRCRAGGTCLRRSRRRIRASRPRRGARAAFRAAERAVSASRRAHAKRLISCVSGERRRRVSRESACGRMCANGPRPPEDVWRRHAGHT